VDGRLFSIMGFGSPSPTCSPTRSWWSRAGLGLTGDFQAVQWACITAAAVLIGVVGGHLAETRELHLAFAIAACFPLVSFLMALFFVHETPPRATRPPSAPPPRIREALSHRDVWMVRASLLLHVQAVLRSRLPLLPDRRAWLQQRFIGCSPR
jgi:MFS family permease